MDGSEANTSDPPVLQLIACIDASGDVRLHQGVFSVFNVFALLWD